MIASVLPCRSSSSVSGNGMKRSMRVPGAKTEPKSNEGGSTPTTVGGVSLSMMLLPTIAGSDANSLRQSALLSITTFVGFAALSSAVNERPSTGCTPSMEKKFCVTGTLLRRIASPFRTRFASPMP